MTKWLHSLTRRAWFRRSTRTFLQSFLALMVPGALGWLNALTEWSKSQGQTPFPDAHSLAYIGVSAITAGVIAVVTGLWTKVEDVAGHGLLRTIDPPPPPPPPNEVGAVSTRTIAVAALVLVVVVLLILLL